MSLSLQAFLALMPILLSAVLLVGLRWSARVAMPVVFFTSILVAYLAWGVSTTHIAAATIQGLFITFDILYIIFANPKFR